VKINCIDKKCATIADGLLHIYSYIINTPFSWDWFFVFVVSRGKLGLNLMTQNAENQNCEQGVLWTTLQMFLQFVWKKYVEWKILSHSRGFYLSMYYYYCDNVSLCPGLLLLLLSFFFLFLFLFLFNILPFFVCLQYIHIYIQCILFHHSTQLRYFVRCLP